jgi:ABC-type transport system substrate-binding protein
MKFYSPLFRKAISTTASVVIIIIIIVAAVGIGAAYVVTRPTTTTSSSSSTTSFTYGPKNSSLLIDDSCQTGCAPPDSLDPAYAFFSQDDTYLTAVFQDLAVMNGTSGTVVLPVESTGWKITNNSQQYTFSMRPDVYFSNGDNVTAYTIWFSYVREIYMNAPSLVGLSNWNKITVNSTDWFASTCGDYQPWGLINAVSAVTGIKLTVSNCPTIQNFLNNMLSHFDPATNSTQASIIAYPHQAYSANSTSTFIIRTIRPYADVVQDLAGFSGTHTVEPAFVDANGGVQANTANSYLSTSCEPGTGPYECFSVESGLAEMTLKANPHYWAKGSEANGLKTGLPWVIAPPHIPVIEIEYGITGNPTLQYANFGTNVAAISEVGITQWKSMWSAFTQKSHFEFKQIVQDYGPGDFSFYLGMDSERFPTNITDLRLAVINALNYTQLADTEIYYNGTAYGSLVLGPGIPPYGSLYNPDKLPLQTQNVNLAAHYLDLAGKANGFFTVMANGTTLGDASGKPLAAIQLFYILPLTPYAETQLDIFQSNLAAIGISMAATGYTSAVFDTLAADPATAPPLNVIAWGIDYPDPFYNQFLCFFTTDCGITTYVNNATLTSLVTAASFSTNQAFRLQVDQELYQISLKQGYYAWLPYTDLVDWVQPYVKGLYQNIYIGFFYNLIYYQPVTVRS